MWQQSMAEEKWYAPVDIGQHLDLNGMAEEKLSKAEVKEIFRIETFLKEEALKKYEHAKSEWFKGRGADYFGKFKNHKIFNLDKEDHPISANVYEFSQSKAKIYIKFIYGCSRWHHYYIVLGNYLVERDPYIDEVFGLKDLEKKYAYSFKGIAHGMPLKAAEEILGSDYDEYAGQSPQYRNIYYERHNIEIVIQDGTVKYLQKGKPAWMTTEMKFKNQL